MSFQRNASESNGHPSIVHHLSLVSHSSRPRQPTLPAGSQGVLMCRDIILSLSDAQTALNDLFLTTTPVCHFLGIVPDLHSMLKRSVNQDSHLTPRPFSTPGAFPPWTYLSILVNSPRKIDIDTPSFSSSVSTMEDGPVTFRSSFKG